MSRASQRVITSLQELREVVGAPAPIAANKTMDRLDAHARRFISLSPFLCFGTMSADGNADVTPRGDPPGFVKVVDDRTLVIPDRPGNRRVDSMENLIANPSIGIIFFVPGIEETLRVSGRARVIQDDELLAEMEVRGHVPRLAIRVEVEEVFFHCAKALKRARLWDPRSRIDRSEFPPYGQVIHDQRLPEVSAQEVERMVQEDYRKDLY